jgi:hypothetical protein
VAQRHCQRRSALVAGVTLAALVVTGHAGAAGGSPLPVPDDPPAGATVAGRTATQARPAARATTTSPAAAPVPTPDAPVVAAAQPSSAARAPSTAAVSPPPVQPAATTSVVRTAPRTTPSGPTRRAAPVARAARPSGKASASKAAKAAKAAPSKPARTAEPAATALRVPHDTLRLALPVGALIVGRPDRGPDPGLLVLAAFLLATAAAGGFVLGVAARSAARHA